MSALLNVFSVSAPQPDNRGEFETPAQGAKFMASFGIPQIPLKGKVPFQNDWPSKATTDFAEIDRLYAEFKCNFGSLAQAKLGGHFVFEVDSADVRSRFKTETTNEFTPTLTIRSSSDLRGHRWYQQSQGSIALGNVSQSNVVGEDFSVRVDREQAVSPGSIHPETGTQYRVAVGIEPVEASSTEIAWFGKQRTMKKKIAAADANLPVVKGDRNTALASLCGKWLVSGLNARQIEMLALAENEHRFEPPLGEDEVLRTVASICRYEPGKQFDLKIGGRLPQDTISAAKPNEANATTAPQELEPFFTVTGDLFMKENIPPRQVLVRTISHGEPVFFGPSINQIFAWRGMGKTNLGFGLVAALSRGEKFLNWEAPVPVKVLYVEGELPAAQVQERWKQIIGTTNGQARLITIDKQTNSTMTSLATSQGMDRLEKTLATLEADGFKVEVLFLDSISTLFNVGANDEETWIAIQAWFISLRSRGICIFFFHHAGKSGLSRSHSKSEDMLDVSIKLEAPKEPEPGCLHAVMSYDKARSGLSEAPAEIKMHRAHSEACECKKTGKLGCSGDSVTWLYEPSISVKKQQALRMFADGMTVRAVAKELKAPIGTINSWRTEWSGREHAIGVRGMEGIKVQGINLDAPSVPEVTAQVQ